MPYQMGRYARVVGGWLAWPRPGRWSGDVGTAGSLCHGGANDGKRLNDDYRQKDKSQLSPRAAYRGSSNVCRGIWRLQLGLFMHRIMSARLSVCGNPSRQRGAKQLFPFSIGSPGIPSPSEALTS